MKYCVSVDWLAMYCKLPIVGFAETFSAFKHDCKRTWTIKAAEYGTRQFKFLHFLFLNGEEFAEVQSVPHSMILKKDSCIVRIVNRQLYTPTVFYDLQCFFDDLHIMPEGLSRCDLCADFNAFKDYDCVRFIKDFLASTIRHKGRGKGSAYFNHYAKNEFGISKSHVDYTGLAFGSRESDVRAYLYNKSWELLTVKDKPYIRDLWRAAGLNVSKPVWRLEFSLHSKARKFKDKMTGKTKEITRDDIADKHELQKLYLTFVHKYWAFIKNRANITNISREPTLNLFSLDCYYLHTCLRDVSGGNRTERILIKQLWQMSETYRGYDCHTDEGVTKSIALALAEHTDLIDWLEKKTKVWEKPNRK